MCTRLLSDTNRAFWIDHLRYESPKPSRSCSTCRCNSQLSKCYVCGIQTYWGNLLDLKYCLGMPRCIGAVLEAQDAAQNVGIVHGPLHLDRSFTVGLPKATTRRRASKTNCTPRDANAPISTSPLSFPRSATKLRRYATAGEQPERYLINYYPVL